MRIETRRVRDSCYRLRYYSPVQRAFFFLLALASAVLLIGMAYVAGTYAGGWRQDVAIREISRLESRVTELESHNADLQARNADLQARTAYWRQAFQIENEAASEVGEALTALQSDMAQLDQELSFYKGIVTPSDRTPGLHVEDFLIERGSHPHGYRYTLVLIQIQGHHQSAEGGLQLYLEGEQDGQATQLSLADLSRETKEVKFSFKYLHTVEGRLRLPEGFRPAAVRVVVRPEDGELEAVEQTYVWDEVLKGA